MESKKKKLRLEKEILNGTSGESITVGEKVLTKWIDTKEYESVVVGINPTTYTVRFIEDSVEYQAKKHLVKPLQSKINVEVRNKNSNELTSVINNLPSTFSENNSLEQDLKVASTDNLSEFSYSSSESEYKPESESYSESEDDMMPSKGQSTSKTSILGNKKKSSNNESQVKPLQSKINVEVRNKNSNELTSVINNLPSTFSENNSLEQDLKVASTDNLSEFSYSSSESEYKPESESYSESEDDMMPSKGQSTSKTSILGNKKKSSNNESQGIVVCPTTNAKDERHYDKKYFCFFCESLFSKLPRHLESKHPDEVEVAEIMALKSEKSKEAQTRRKNLLMKLRNLGSHKWNCNVLKSGYGELLVTYRPSNESVDPHKYIPCPTCYGYYTKTELWRHHCPLNENKKKYTKSMYDSRNLLPMRINVNDDVKNVLVSMKQDAISRAAKNDPTICEFIRRMFTLKGGEQNHKKCEIRNNAREISRLLVQLRKETDRSSYTLEDFFKTSHYKEIITAVKVVAGFNEKRKEFAAPELARKLGLHIKSCATYALAKAIEEDNKYLLQDLEQFLKLHKMNYFVDIGAQARRNRIKNQRNKAKLLPLSNDVMKLSKHISKITDNSIDTLKSEKASIEDKKAAYINLQKSILAQIIVFNRRREGEVSRTTVDDYKNRKETNEVSDLEETLSKTEKGLCRILTRMEIQGKGGRNVPVLLTKKMQEGIEISFEYREVVGVLKNNNYLFANCNKGSSLHYRGSDCLRQFSKECGATNSKALRSTKLRKQVATLSQIINLKTNELDSLANFMGHDIRIHREYYRIPDNVMQVAKLSKLFLALEDGKLHHQTGKTLDEIQVSLEENALEEHTDENFEINRKEDLEGDSDSHQGSSSSDLLRLHPTSNPCRRKWSDEEKAAVNRHLSGHILRGKLPGASEAKRCIAAEPVLASRSWRNVKDFCRNLIIKRK